MAGLFGTDGVRARINTGSMTAEAVVRLALAAGRWFADYNPGQALCSRGDRQGYKVVGYMIEAAMVAGFTSIGMDCRLRANSNACGRAFDQIFARRARCDDFSQPQSAP